MHMAEGKDNILRFPKAAEAEGEFRHFLNRIGAKPEAMSLLSEEERNTILEKYNDQPDDIAQVGFVETCYEAWDRQVGHIVSEELVHPVEKGQRGRMIDVDARDRKLHAYETRLLENLLSWAAKVGYYPKEVSSSAPSILSVFSIIDHREIESRLDEVARPLRIPK